VHVEARAKNFNEAVGVQDTIAALLPAGARVVLNAVNPAGSAVQGVMSIFGLDASIRTFAPLLPKSWAVATGDRTLTIDTHPPNLLGKWQGTFEFDSGFGTTLTCLPDEPLCAHLTVTAEPNGLRLAYCNDTEIPCTGSAAGAQCSLLFGGVVAPGGFVGVGFDNNPPCCVGCIGQDRVYGCTITATVTTDRHGQQTLEAMFPGGVTFCSSDPTDAGVTHLKLCRPKPCPVPGPPWRARSHARLPTGRRGRSAARNLVGRDRIARVGDTWGRDHRGTPPAQHIAAWGVRCISRPGWVRHYCSRRRAPPPRRPRPPARHARTAVSRAAWRNRSAAG
jgi:hypothetical protein